MSYLIKCFFRIYENMYIGLSLFVLLTINLIKKLSFLFLVSSINLHCSCLVSILSILEALSIRILMISFIMWPFKLNVQWCSHLFALGFFGIALKIWGLLAFCYCYIFHLLFLLKLTQMTAFLNEELFLVSTLVSQGQNNTMINRCSISTKNHGHLKMARGYLVKTLCL